MQKNENLRINKRKQKKKKKLLFILIPMLIIFGVVGGYIFDVINQAEEIMDNSYEADGRDKSDYRDERVDPKVDDVSILFIGVDESEKRGNESNGLSDALILATL